MPEPKNQASGRRRVLRNIVAVGAAAVGGLLLGDKADLLPTVNAACTTKGSVAFYTCSCALTGDKAYFSWCDTYHRLGIRTNCPQEALHVAGCPCSPNILIGNSKNRVKSGVHGSSILGGGCAAHPNKVCDDYSTVSGGTGNTASGLASAVVGGTGNSASGSCSTVGGGECNKATGFAATVPGGGYNIAAGEFSFAAGHRAIVGMGCPPTLHCGTFLFADSSNVNFRSATCNEFAVRATGGFRFVTAICSSSGSPTQTTAISSSGFLGVGTATPEAPLTVVSGTSITAALIGTSQGNLIFAKSGTNGFSMYSNAANYLGFYSNDSGLQPLTMNGSGVAVGNAYKSTAPPTNGAIIEGSVGIGTSAPTQTLSVQGTAGKSCGGSTWATFSDRRWKCPDSFRPFTEGLAWVRSLPPPMRFHYAKGNGIGADPAKEHVNFIAQCLLDGTHQNLVSEIQAKVKTDDKEPTTTYAVNVSDMQFALVNAIKELAEQNAALKEQLAEQNQKLAEENKKIREEVGTLQQTVEGLATS